MAHRLRKLPLLVPALLAVLALGGCGDSHTRVTTGTYAGESGANAPYLYVGPLIYEVQLSRQLNPANSEDASFLAGLTPEQRKLEPGQEWFAVFMQVYNQTGKPHPASDSFTIEDTQENRYTPVLPGETNQFAYRAGTVQANNQIPLAGTMADEDSAQGLVLLYKIQIVSLDNRPLELKIASPENPSETATAELDV
ncbi:MAG TPA: hypothetical protein VGY13_09730 [Solirubrobacteraceae bacterium]|jgi:hypothetical protein|nr:hypothetical protein [Solirubrobacteraceae bacterium]